MKRSLIPRIKSIRIRLLFTFVAIVLLTAGTISAVTVALGTRDGEKRVIDQLESVATLKESEIDTWMNSLHVNLKLILSNDQAVDDIRLIMQAPPTDEAGGQTLYARLQDRFKWTADSMDLFDELFLMDSTGQILISTNAKHEGEVHSIYDYFIAGSKGYYVQQPSYSLPLEKMTVVVSAPVKLYSQTLGVLAGRASLLSLNQIMMERTGLGDTGETYLIGSNHQLLTNLRVNGFPIPETYIRTGGANTAIEGHRNGNKTYRNYSDKSVIGVYRWIDELEVALVAEQEAGEALRPTHMVLMIISGVALGAVLLAILAAIVLTRSIIRPLNKLAGTAKRITEGDLDRQAEVDRDDEIGTVAQAFNTMTQRLRALVRDLEQRTEQLRTVNEVGRSISSILQLDELLPYVAGSLQESFNYHAVGILFIDQPSGGLIFKAGAGDYAGGADERMIGKGQGSIVGSVARTGEPMMVNDVANDPAYCGDEEPGHVRAELAVPIKISGRLVGVLDIEESRIDAFSEIDLFIVQTLADQMAIAIENARLYEQAQELATVEERQRLARDLHDAVTQTLFSASLIAEVLPILWEKNPQEGKRRLEELRRSTKGALAEMRILLLELRPAALTEVGLDILLRQMTDAATGRSGNPVSLVVEGQGTLPPDIQIALYRIAQEALNNAQKHAEATTITVTLKYKPGLVELAITDDGAGFDPRKVSAEHLGLGIMKERTRSIDATLNIVSRIGQGTSILITCPIPKDGE